MGDLDMHGVPRVLICSILLVVGATKCPAMTIHVDVDATGAGDGSSWADAYTDLSAALQQAMIVGGIVEVRVAEGTYLPDPVGLADPREATFLLVNDVSIQGGYAGIGAPDPDKRNVSLYTTTLSGDLVSNNIPGNASDNCYHVVTGSGTDETAVLDGFTVIDGNGQGSPSNENGDHLLIDAGCPTIRNVTFSGYANWTYSVYCADSEPRFLDCLFGPYTPYGANIGFWDSQVSLENCIVPKSPLATTNIIARDGSLLTRDCQFSGCIVNINGALTTIEDSVFKDNSRVHSSTLMTVFTNCLFLGNSRSISGRNTNVVCTNCTFYGNSSPHAGVVYSFRQTSITFNNCILWENEPSPLGGNQLTVTAYNTCFQDDDPDDGVVPYDDDIFPTNIDNDPVFVDPLGPDEVLGTDDDDFRLRFGSPCIDSGTNEPVTADADPVGAPRIVNGLVDMGAFEHVSPSFVLDTQVPTVPEGGTSTLAVSLASNPGGVVEVVTSVVSGDPDITLLDGTSLTFDSEDYAIPQFVTFAAAEDDDFLVGHTSMMITAPGLSPAFIAPVEIDNEPVPSAIRVDSAAQPGGDGADWQAAVSDLHAAMDLAADYEIGELWVAAGTYLPEKNGLRRREFSFALRNNLALYGGFAGHESERDQRDFRANETILSGDLEGNDGYFTNLEDNCHTIVDANGTDSTAILDGFTITGANNEAHPDSSGLACGSAGPTVVHCTFRQNSAVANPVIAIGMDGSPTIESCLFFDNRRAEPGDAVVISADACAAKIVNCTFAANSGPPGCAGALHSKTTTDSVSNCIFWNNSGPQITVEDSAMVLSNSNIEGGWLGPGTNNLDADPMFVDFANGDLRLLPESPSIDAGANADVVAGLDLDGNSRLFNGVVDMGAYEFIAIPGDLDCDGAIGMSDLDHFLQALIDPVGFAGCDLDRADLNGDGLLNGKDIAFFVLVILPDARPFEAEAGDMNCDGTLDFSDVPPFIAALIDPPGFTGCNITQADMNGDGMIDGDDLQPFIVAVIAE